MKNNCKPNIDSGNVKKKIEIISNNMNKKCNDLAVLLNIFSFLVEKVDGGWSKWSKDWSKCSKTCGGGVKEKTRTCTKPAPSGGGKPCEGESTKTIACGIKPCKGKKTYRRPSFPVC